MGKSLMEFASKNTADNLVDTIMSEVANRVKNGVEFSKKNINLPAVKTLEQALTIVFDGKSTLGDFLRVKSTKSKDLNKYPTQVKVTFKKTAISDFRNLVLGWCDGNGVLVSVKNAESYVYAFSKKNAEALAVKTAPADDVTVEEMLK
jgi:hypothetical protein